MSARHASVDELRRAISTEVLVAVGVPRISPLQALLRPLVWPPAHRFARLAADFDRRIAQSGLTAAARWALPRFVDDIDIHGTQHVPATGPLIVASNHPGSYDSLVAMAALARDDLKIIVSDVPFLRGMVATSPHLIYTTGDAQVRMTVLRECIRHLRAGGSLLIFGTGQVDPDPALLPGAPESVQNWSSSLPLLLRTAPESILLACIVSGVLAPACFRHPLARLRKEQRPRQFLAEFLQVSQQVLFGRRFGLTPAIRFAQPLTAADVDIQDSQAVLAALIVRAQGLLPGATTTLDSPWRNHEF
jgi:hypothetical protein